MDHIKSSTLCAFLKTNEVTGGSAAFLRPKSGDGHLALAESSDVSVRKPKMDKHLDLSPLWNMAAEPCWVQQICGCYDGMSHHGHV